MMGRARTQIPDKRARRCAHASRLHQPTSSYALKLWDTHGISELAKRVSSPVPKLSRFARQGSD